MANTGNVFAGTGENVDRSGLTAWTSPGSVTADDTTDATCNAAGSDYLVARNFNFSSIPDGSTINGILVRVEASEHSASTEALLAQLQDDVAALTGSSKSTSNEGNISGTAKAVYTYGSTSDVWGASLTAAMVKDADFGVRLWFTTSHDVRIDFVTMAVEYTPPIQALDGDVSGALTVSGSLSVTRGLQGSGTGTLTVSGTVKATMALQGSATGTLAVSGDLKPRRGLVGAGTGTLSASGSLSVVLPPIMGGRNGRASVINYDLWGRAFPNPDGGWSAADRVQTAGKYGGLYSQGLDTAARRASAILYDIGFGGRPLPIPDGSNPTAADRVQLAFKYTNQYSTVPAGELEALQGSAAGTLTTSGVLNVLKTFVGAAAGTLTTTGNLNVSHPLTGSAAGTLTTTGSVNVLKTFVGSAAGTLTVAGSLSSTFVLSGSITGTLTVSGSLSVTRRLAGALTGTLTLEDLSGGDVELAGAASGTLTTAGVLAVTRNLLGAVAGALAVAGVLNATHTLQGSVTGTLTANAAASVTRGLAGSLSGALTISGSLQVSRTLQGSAAGALTIAGTLTDAPPPGPGGDLTTSFFNYD